MERVCPFSLDSALLDLLEQALLDNHYKIPKIASDAGSTRASEAILGFL